MRASKEGKMEVETMIILMLIAYIAGLISAIILLAPRAGRWS